MFASSIEKRTIDLPFYPTDDISYHPSDEKNKKGIRCVVVIPNGYVRTAYVERSFPSIYDILLADKTECNVCDVYSDSIWYESDGSTRYLTIIYLQYGEDVRKQCCVEYNGEPLTYANGCIITGENFTDLSMDECYGLVMSARAKERASDKHVCVNITKDFNLIPRLIIDEE